MIRWLREERGWMETCSNDFMWQYNVAYHDTSNSTTICTRIDSLDHIRRIIVIAIIRSEVQYCKNFLLSFPLARVKSRFVWGTLHWHRSYAEKIKPDRSAAVYRRRLLVKVSARQQGKSKHYATKGDSFEQAAPTPEEAKSTLSSKPGTSSSIWAARCWKIYLKTSFWDQDDWASFAPTITAFVSRPNASKFLEATYKWKFGTGDTATASFNAGEKYRP